MFFYPRPDSGRGAAHKLTQVASLAELSDEELDKFAMRKLEKRKLRHHLQSAWVPDGVALRC